MKVFATKVWSYTVSRAHEIDENLNPTEITNHTVFILMNY